MKRRKVGNIAIVVGDDALRAAQRVDGRLLSARVPLEGDAPDLKAALRKLLSAAPFVGRSVAVGIEGRGVLVESVVMPTGRQGEAAARAYCAHRLKGDPLFSEERARLCVHVHPEEDGCRALATLAAIDSERLEAILAAGRGMELTFQTMEPAATATWRTWPGEGRQARFIGSGTSATVLAGIDDRLVFCRTVPEGLSVIELSRTLQRAASLLCIDSFDRLLVDGLSEEDMDRVSQDLGMAVTRPDAPVHDPAAVGLATEGAVLLDFTPADERMRVEKRRVHRMRTTMITAAALFVALSIWLGNQQVEALTDRRAALEGQVMQLRDTRFRLDTMHSELERQQANEAVIEQARPGHRMSTLFALLAMAAGDELSLESIRISDEERPSRVSGNTGPVAHVLEVHLAGLASSGFSVRSFVDRLLETGAFSDVRVDDSRRVLLSLGVEGERFQILAQAETR